MPLGGGQPHHTTWGRGGQRSPQNSGFEAVPTIDDDDDDDDDDAAAVAAAAVGGRPAGTTTPHHRESGGAATPRHREDREPRNGFEGYRGGGGWVA